MSPHVLLSLYGSQNAAVVRFIDTSAKLSFASSASTTHTHIHIHAFTLKTQTELPMSRDVPAHINMYVCMCGSV